MKLIYILIGIFLLHSCEKTELNENEILEMIHSHKGYENSELKKDFSYGADFIDSIKTFRETIKKENFKPIFEADLNNDGKKDYLVNLSYPETKDNIIVKILINEDYYHTALLLSSDAGYQLLNPGKQKVYDIFSAKIIFHRNQHLIKLVNFKRHSDNKNDLIQYDTLMIKNNQLTEFISSINKHHIEKIIFTQIGGYAPGIEYQLTLNKDSIILQSNFYKNLEGRYSGNNISSFKNIAEELNQIGFEN
ncbi:hypothetical protein MQX03_05240 [Chryseobacterium aahli]|uniref:hypothetical protein n=1 Tax=Chryseobacterium aahli TaxID=1278643 RepID=UPI001F60B559|nr:hypothetical protein [Chryseobacterium aahli]MCI3936591.1 hypothetical protein [Chryseobacterium aahli]